MLYPIILALLSIIACTASSRLEVREPCDDMHYLCFPPEGEEWDIPNIDTGIRNLLKDLEKSVQNPWDKKRDLTQSGDTLVGRAPSDDDLCCKSTSINRRGQHRVTVLTENAGFLGDGCYSLRKRRAPFCYVSIHELRLSFFTFTDESLRIHSIPTSELPAVSRGILTPADTSHHMATGSIYTMETSFSTMARLATFTMTVNRRRMRVSRGLPSRRLPRRHGQLLPLYSRLMFTPSKEPRYLRGPFIPETTFLL